MGAEDQGHQFGDKMQETPHVDTVGNEGNFPPALEERSRVIPYPAIGHHGIIGDRRTCALIAADGTMNWLCLPDFDGSPVFGSLLDWAEGGYWRLGPAQMAIGSQSYLGDSVVLETRWSFDDGKLLLQDVMLWPETDRSPEKSRVRTVVRRLSCTEGRTRVEFALDPAHCFQSDNVAITGHDFGFTIEMPEMSLRLWSSRRLSRSDIGFRGVFELAEGEEVWAVLEYGAAGHGWSVESARQALNEAPGYWQAWLGNLRGDAGQMPELRRTAITVHLLTYAPEGSVVAAATTSLPERIGGGWNADYRFCWVRDASLSVSALALLGNLVETEQYLQWLVKRLSRLGTPLQVLYEIRGGKRPKQRRIENATGYRGSVPVRFGNHAFRQKQIGSFGFLADCVWTYLNNGGQWREEYGKLILRVAAYTCRNWQSPENGIWELSERKHFLNSKVLSWVTLDRSIKIARMVNPSFDVGEWETSSRAIHADIMEKGWSERLDAFRQHYEGENLDASGLLIPIMDFLPPDHPRVLATIKRISEFLTMDDFVYRFNPLETPGAESIPLGQMEGSFFPCTFWLATAYAKAGWVDRAERIINTAEQLAGPLGLFSEGCDPRNRSLVGNTPLLFSHVEYVRAKLELARCKRERSV